MIVTCPVCRGTGRQDNGAPPDEHDDWPCETCHESGVLSPTHPVVRMSFYEMRRATG
jgi:DnaJ-class molecular chaperone